MSTTGRIGDRLILSLGITVLAGVVFVACGEDGESPLCPDLGLYDIGNAGERNSPDRAQERAEAVDAGCLTPPMVDAGSD
jgi:hypothetical protein